MFLATFRTRIPLHIRTTTFFLLRLWCRPFTFVDPVNGRRTLIGEPFIEPWLILHIKSSLGRISIFGHCPLQFLPTCLSFLFLNLLCMNHETRVSILGINTTNLHSFTTRSDTPITNLFILALEFTTIIGACLDS